MRWAACTRGHAPTPTPGPLRLQPAVWPKRARPLPAPDAHPIVFPSHRLLQAMWYEVASGRAYLAAKQYGKVGSHAALLPARCMLPSCLHGGAHPCPRGRQRLHTGGPALARYRLPRRMRLVWHIPLHPRPPASPRARAQALKRFLKVQQHFEDFQEDQFDFHGYCVRKMVGSCCSWHGQCGAHGRCMAHGAWVEGAAARAPHQARGMPAASAQPCAPLAAPQPPPPAVPCCAADAARVRGHAAHGGPAVGPPHLPQGGLGYLRLGCVT